MKFDYCIGNPPYQESYQGDSSGANSIYDKFVDAAYTVADKVELITPARFLFNAGSTPKDWNEKMLNDDSFKVLNYEPDSDKVFPSLKTPIKGGVAIHYHDPNMNYGSIGIFTQYEQLNGIVHKVVSYPNVKSISDICVTSSAYHFTEDLHTDFPDLKKRTIIVKGKEQPLLSKGHEYDLKSSIFEKIPEVFEEPSSAEEYVQILGRTVDGREKRYIKRRYITDVKNLYVYKVFLPKASGVGQFGEVLSSPVIEGPGVGATETFYSIGLCSTLNEVENILKYIKTKFSRTLLSILKSTQDINPGKWKYVPLQDFTSNSDIDWNQSIADIDKQLYRKYGLSKDEIDFIETHVKEMN